MTHQSRVLRSNRFQDITNQLLGSRWLLILLLPVSFIFTGFAAESSPYYFFLTLSASISFAILQTRLRKPFEITFPIWVILFVFLLGYFVQFFWMITLLSSGADWLFDPLALSLARSPRLMFRAYEVMTWGFVSFCLTGWFVLGLEREHDTIDKKTKKEMKIEGISKWGALGLGFIGIIMLLTAYIQFVTAIAVAGTEQVQLPFRLAGVIVYLRNVTIPVLLLVYIFVGEESNKKYLHQFALGLLIVHGLIQMVLMSSRGWLLLMVLPLLPLWLLTGRFSHFKRNILTVIFIFIMVLHPIISQYRNQRLASDPRHVVSALGLAITSMSETENNLAVEGFQNVLARVQGLNSLLFMIRYSSPLPSIDNIQYYLFNPSRSLARIYTQDIVGLNTWYHLSAPSLLGTFYLLSGIYGVVIGSAVWTIFWQSIWNLLKRLRWYSLPVMQSMILLVLLTFSSEGDIDNLPFRFAIYAFSFWIGELLARALVVNYGHYSS